MSANKLERPLEPGARTPGQSGTFPRSRPITEPPLPSPSTDDDCFAELAESDPPPARESLPPARESFPPESLSEAWCDCTSAYDAFAEAITRPFAEDAVRLVKLAPGARVLDVAAGTGAFAVAAARRGAEVLATDFSPSMIRELARKCRSLHLHTITAQVMDGQDLELPDGCFDVAASLFGLMFFPDHDQGLRELHRVLKPGGQAVVAVWAQPARVELMRLMGEAAMSAMIELPTSDAPAHWAELSSPRNLQRRVLAAGFAKVYVVSLAHVWTVDRPETVAEILPYATPSASAVLAQLSEANRTALLQALVADLCERQGGGPFAVANEALIAVATKSL